MVQAIPEINIADCKNFTYFVEAVGVDAVKIGKTDNTDVQFRIQSLQCGNPLELKILGVARGDICPEKTVHLKFQHLRIRGEWFRKTPELLAFIEKNAVDMYTFQKEATELTSIIQKVKDDHAAHLLTVRELVLYEATEQVTNLHLRLLNVYLAHRALYDSKDPNISDYDKNMSYKETRGIVGDIIEDRWQEAQWYMNAFDRIYAKDNTEKQIDETKKQVGEAILRVYHKKHLEPILKALAKSNCVAFSESGLKLENCYFCW